MTKQAMIDQVQQDPHLWWGFAADHGWVVLDRTDLRNQDEEMLSLTRCQDWQGIQVPKPEFGSGRFQWFVNYLGSLPEEGQQAAVSTLMRLREEFLSRRSGLQAMTEGDWLTGSVP